MKEIISFEKIEEKEVEGKIEKGFIKCEKKEATHKLIRKPMDRPYNQEFPTKRIKL